MPITPALSGAKMARNQGVTRDFLAPNVASTSKIQQIDSDRFLGRNITAGNGNTQQVQPWYDVQVPDWTTGAHVTNWSTLQYYLSSVAQTNSLVPASANYISTFGSFPGDNSYTGAILAPNGKFYLKTGGSRSGSLIRVIDPITQTISVIGTFVGGAPGLGDNDFIGGALAPNGKIYCHPYNATVFLVIDPSNNTVTRIGTYTSEVAKYNGSILAPNGKIYGTTDGQSLIRVIDPDTNTLSVVGTYPGSCQGFTSVVWKNGKIYTMPDGDSKIKILDPNNNTVTTFTVPSGDLRVIGGILAPNEKIYCVPFGGSSFAYFDPSDNSFSTFGAFTPFTDITWPTGSSYFGAVLVPNGKIYTVPYNHSLLRVVDPENNTVSVIATITGSQKYIGGNLGPNGNVYMFPNYATNILCINILNNNVFNINVNTNPNYNRGGM